MQIAEIYNTVESHESLTECQEVTLVLENYLRDFNSLAEWFRLKWDYENTPAPQRPTSLAWEISKTNISKTNRSGKSTPSVGSGRNSPNTSGKVSPRLLNSMLKSAPTSPLPTHEENIESSVINETHINKENTEVSAEKNKIPVDNKTLNVSGESHKSSDENFNDNSNVMFTKENVDDDKIIQNTESLNKLKEEMGEKKSDKIESFKTPISNVDSPSEDQKTYDIFRKVGVQSSEKSTSTNDDFPRLPLKKISAVKINQECQTDDLETKTLPSNKTTNKTEISKVVKNGTNIKPAYSMALTRSASAKAVSSTRPKFDVVKPTISTAAKVVQKPIKPTVTTKPLPSTAPRNFLSRSKTVGDIKSSQENSMYKPIFKYSKTDTNKSAPIKPKTIKSNSLNSPKNFNSTTKTNRSNDYSSSVETLVNPSKSTEGINATNSSNSIASSVETLSNENIKDDGWLTVKCRSRFKSNGKGRKSDTALSWATRFHQVSATASLPALALLPEPNEKNKSVANKSLPFYKQENGLPSKKHSLQSGKFNKLPLRRSHTTLNKLTLSNNNSLKSLQGEKNKSNYNTKKSMEMRKKIAEVDSETDDEIKLKDTQDDLASEEEHRKKAKQLTEEEERLNQEIAQLQGLDIDVDTETDGTETDGELQCDNDEHQTNGINAEGDEMSLEARYEPMLAGNYLLFVLL